MSWWQAIILGIVQGLTEFLPVSSSGHLILTREVMGVHSADFLLFDILLHVGSLVAVILIFRKDILKLFKPPFKTLGLLILATIPAGIVGVIISLYGPSELFDSPIYLWIFFLYTAIILFTAELVSKKQTVPQFFTDCGKGIKKVFTKQYFIDCGTNIKQFFVDWGISIKSFFGGKKQTNEIEIQNEPENNAAAAETETVSTEVTKSDEPLPLQDIKLKHTVAMGLMQAVAIFPGASRSGSTIFGGVVTKGKRESVAKFSFFMSIPIILAAAVWETIDLIRAAGSVEVASNLASVSPWGYALGMIAAFVTGIFAIKFMLKLIAKADFKWFALYLFILSMFTLFYYFVPFFRG